MKFDTRKKLQEQPKPTKVFYYDLPISEDAPEHEIKICAYLHSKNVRMSGPPVIVDNLYVRPVRKSLRPKKGPSLLQSKRKEKFSKYFANLELAIEVPIKSS